MKQQTITITISGKAKTGKSRIIYLIKEMLKVHDLDVVFKPSIDFANENDFNKHMRTNFDEAIEQISKKTKIIIQEEQEKYSMDEIQISQSMPSNVSYEKGDIIIYERWKKGDQTPEIFECIKYDEDWGVVWYNDNGRKDTIGTAYIRKATDKEKIKFK